MTDIRMAGAFLVSVHQSPPFGAQEFRPDTSKTRSPLQWGRTPLRHRLQVPNLITEVKSSSHSAPDAHSEPLVCGQANGERRVICPVTAQVQRQAGDRGQLRRAGRAPGASRLSESLRLLAVPQELWVLSGPSFLFPGTYLRVGRSISLFPA